MKITIYSKADCPQCIRAKKLLEKNGFEYEEVRIDLDESARNFLIEQGHRTVPQIYFNNKVLVENGFEGLRKLSNEEIKKRLEIDNVNQPTV